MAIEGLPDPARHRPCMRCREWFEPDEGSAATKQSFGVAGSIADSVRAAAGDARVGFLCHRCQAVRRVGRVVLYAALGLALAWAAFKELGWL